MAFPPNDQLTVENPFHVHLQAPVSKNVFIRVSSTIPRLEPEEIDSLIRYLELMKTNSFLILTNKER